MSKFIDEETFKKFKEEFINDELNQLKQSLNDLQNNLASTNSRIDEIYDKAEKASRDAEQNNKMLQEINFTDIQQKIKKIKDETDQKLGEFSIKLKKKVGLAELSEI